jgi:hypothetical protein
MIHLPLRPTIVNDRPLANDFSVIWRSEAFGDNRVGRIRLATEHAEAERWEWGDKPANASAGLGPRHCQVSRSRHRCIPARI